MSDYTVRNDNGGQAEISILFLFLVSFGLAQLLMCADQAYDLIRIGYSLPLRLWVFYVVPLTVISTTFTLVFNALGLYGRHRKLFPWATGAVCGYLLLMTIISIHDLRIVVPFLAIATAIGSGHIFVSRSPKAGPFLRVFMSCLIAIAASINLQLSPEKCLGLSVTSNFGIELSATIMFFAYIVLLLKTAGARNIHLVGANVFLLLFLVITSLQWQPSYGIITKESFTDPPLITGKSTSKRPNIVLIVLDTMRRDHLSVYGYEHTTTPFLEQFSKEAIIYRNAYSVSNWTMPAHASLFTGKFPRSNGAVRYANYLGKDQITMAEILKEIGYRCGAVSSNTAWVNRLRGMAQGFDFFYTQSPLLTSVQHCDLINAFVYFFGGVDSIKYLSGYLTGNYVNSIALEWVKNQRQPWFLFLNYMETHAPYYPPPEYRGLFPGRRFTPPVNIYDPYLDPNNYSEHLVSQYDGEVYTVDRYLQQLINSFREMGVLDNTMVVITSDHGELLGEHSDWGHFRSASEEELQIPLIIRYPGEKERGEVLEPVQIHEVFLIILKALNITAGEVRKEYFDDINEASKLRKRLSARGIMLFEFNSWGDKSHKNGTAMIKGRKKLIIYPDGKKELFDIMNDPGEDNDLAMKLPKLLRELEKEHDEIWSGIPKVRNPPKVGILKRDALTNLRDLGYIQ